MQGEIMHSGYVAFLDVLGFSALLAGENHSTRINDYLSCLSNLNAKDGGPKIEYTVFSDSIVITTGASEESLRTLLRECSCAFGALLEKEIPVRGAIAHGSYITETTESGRFVAGRAILEAYRFEEKQDWVGIMIAPSVLRTIPDLRERCLIEDPHNPEILTRFFGRLPWAAYVQPSAIPFHGDPAENNTYDGFAVVPSSGNSEPAILRDSLAKSIQRLMRLKSLAPDPAAQQKYVRSRIWLDEVRSQWHNAAFRLSQTQSQ